MSQFLKVDIKQKKIFNDLRRKSNSSLFENVVAVAFHSKMH
jgi:hypothetical protein